MPCGRVRLHQVSDARNPRQGPGSKERWSAHSEKIVCEAIAENTVHKAFKAGGHVVPPDGINEDESVCFGDFFLSCCDIIFTDFFTIFHVLILSC